MYAHVRSKVSGQAYSRKIEKMKNWCLYLLVISIAVVAVHGQNLGDFVSIDCGNSRNYTDKNTSLIFTPDDQYIDTGINYNISSSYESQIVQGTDLTLRSFPVGNRNCYTLKPALIDRKYVVRAIFFYGNYDGKYQSKTTFLFDLHIGVNFWRTVNVTDAAQALEYEAIIVSLAEFVSVCLVNKGSGTPFISSLEMRLMKATLYPGVNASNFFDLVRRRDLGGSKVTRYPDDPYDRIWYPRSNDWTVVKTNFDVRTDKFFEVPNVVLQTAILPFKSTNSTNSADPTLNINIKWVRDYAVKEPSICIHLHFAEIQQLPTNGIREFNVFYNGMLEPFMSNERPSYLVNEPLYCSSSLSNPNGFDPSIDLNSTKKATVPPLINALEVFNLMPVTTSMTYLSDVDAIITIKREYQVKKNWSGDPCAPAEYAWADVGCSYDSNSPRIVSLNLSDNGLSGHISTSFSLLEALNMLDLSNNNLNGSIPDFLGNMTSLRLLDLSSNYLSGPIPQVLLTRVNSGQLTLRTDSLGNLPAKPSGKKSSVPLVIGVVAAIFVLLLASLIAWKFLRKPITPPETKLHPVPSGPPIVHLKTRRYTKIELESITENFIRQIGQGGFGKVYAGTLPDEKGTKVAIKTLSESSNQGLREFLTEAENLATLHHKNLVSLIGYGEDKECIALIYEYMSQGSLEDHLQGKRTPRTLSWRERLHVVFEAAEGLNYLHQGCSVPVIHRDIKSSNILLTENLTAKISDLGIARVLVNHKSGIIATNVCGTRGYIDPDYFGTGVLTLKSDVYSFGVILFEIITGQQPGPAPAGPGGLILVERVRQKMAEQNNEIESIIDARLQQDYGLDSVWSVFELARECTRNESEPRPTMEFVVTELKNALKMEDDSIRNGQNNLSINNQDINVNPSAALIPNQNFRTVSDIIGRGPDLR